MNLWFTFFVWFAWNVHASVIIISRSCDWPIWCSIEPISSSFEVSRREELKEKELQLFRFFFSLLLSVCLCVCFILGSFVKTRVDNLSLLVWFLFFFFVFFCLTDSPQIWFIRWDFYFEWFSCTSLQLDPIFEGV